MSCLRTGLSLQTQEPMLHFCSKAGLPLQTQKPMLQFYQGLNWCSSFPLLSAPHFSLTSEQTLKHLKNPRGPKVEVRREYLPIGPSGLHRNSLQRLNISSIRIFLSNHRSGNPNYPSPPIKIKTFINNL